MPQAALPTASQANNIPLAPSAAFLSTRAVPIPARPHPKYRRSFLETFLARQQNKEATNHNSSRLLAPINHIPRPSPVHLPVEDHEDAIGRDTNNLLTLPEQRRSRQNSPNTPTFQDSFIPDPRNTHRTSIALPQDRQRYHRTSMSVDKSAPTSPQAASIKPLSRRNTNNDEKTFAPGLPARLGSNYGLNEADNPSQPPRRVSSQKSLDHVRSIASIKTSSHTKNHSHAGTLPQSPLSQTQAQTPTQTQVPQHFNTAEDLEQGLAETPEDGHRQDEEPAWGPAHPCYPHLNPHVPVDSPAYQATRIIRIRRDWMVVGDLAPTFSEMYPEILDPILPEQEFRYIIDHVNHTLVQAFDPYAKSNWIDGILGFCTGWLWEDLRGGGVKGELRRLERWILDWNRTVGAGDGIKIIPLRRTGYTSLDIQIPDPQVVRVTEMDHENDDSNETSPRQRMSR